MSTKLNIASVLGIALYPVCVIRAAAYVFSGWVRKACGGKLFILKRRGRLEIVIRDNVLFTIDTHGLNYYKNAAGLPIRFSVSDDVAEIFCRAQYIDCGFSKMLINEFIQTGAMGAAEVANVNP